MFGYINYMKTYTIGQFAKLVEKSVNTLQRWDRTNVLKAFRTITGRRYYTEEQIELVLKPQNKVETRTK